MLKTKDILFMLKAYRSNTRIISQLEFELGQIEARLTDEDIIYGLALSVPDGEPVSGGRIRDRTTLAALRYHDDATTQRAQLRESFLKMLFSLKGEIGRIDFYVSLLRKTSRWSSLGSIWKDCVLTISRKR